MAFVIKLNMYLSQKWKKIIETPAGAGGAGGMPARDARKIEEKNETFYRTWLCTELPGVKRIVLMLQCHISNVMHILPVATG